MAQIIPWDGEYRREAIRRFHVLNPKPDSTLFELWMRMQETSLALRNHNAVRKNLAAAAAEAEEAYYRTKLGPNWRVGVDRLLTAVDNLGESGKREKALEEEKKNA